MKKLRLFFLAGLACMALTACDKDNLDEGRVKSFDKFVISDSKLFNSDNKVYLDFNDGLARLLYENNDHVVINGVDFTLSRSGSGASTVWTASGTEITAEHFYCAYADGQASTLSNYSSNTFHFNMYGRRNEATNKILMGGVTDSNVLTLRPACAIIRLMANNDYTNVKVGFDGGKVLKEGTMTITSSDVTISGSQHLNGVTNAEGTGADFLSMEYHADGGYWYVAVPVGTTISTHLYLQWTVSGNIVRKKTGQITLQKGYVYDLGTGENTPFNIDGTSKCAFKVARGQYVRFSPGNLQARTGMVTQWRFAPSQLSFIGSANTTNILDDGLWFDLFGYGTSDWNSGASSYLSYSANPSASSYIQQSLTGSYAHADWGVHNGSSILYGSAASGTTWRTLTSVEWQSLIGRDGKTGLATVDGIKGLMLLPDMKENGDLWDFATELSGIPEFNPSLSDYNSNVYTASEWGSLEAKGVIFLPAAGYRSGPAASPLYSSGNAGYYWSSTFESAGKAFALTFNNSSVNSTSQNMSRGYSVRLVHQTW